MIKEELKNFLQSIKNKEVLDELDFKKIKFINLHAHSTYSLQDAVGQVSEHFVSTIEKGHCGCCITDHGSYASFIDLYNLKDNKIKNKKVTRIFKEKKIDEHPVVMGSELYIIDDRHIGKLEQYLKNGDKESIKKTILKMKENPKWYRLFGMDKEGDSLSKGVSCSEGEMLLKILDDLTIDYKTLETAVNLFNKKSLKNSGYKYNHITLLAKNSIGHSNICHLTSIGSTPENFYTRPRIKMSELLKNKEGIIVTTGCFIGMIPQAIFRNTGEEEELIELFLREFGDDFYIELHISDISRVWNSKTKQHEIQEDGNVQRVVNNRLLDLAKKFKLDSKIYITQDSHMPDAKDKAIQDIMILNSPGNKSGWHFYDTYSIETIETMYKKMKKNYPEYTNEQFAVWCFNSMEVLEKCRNVNIDTSLKFLTPNYKIHPTNNYIRVNESFLSGLLSKGLIKDNVDKSIIKDELRSELESKYENDDLLQLDWEISVEINTRYGKIEDSLNVIFDYEQTKKAYLKNKDTREKALEIFRIYNDYYTQKAKILYSSDLDFQTLVNVAISLNKIDFNDDYLRIRFFSELDIIHCNGVIALSDYFMTFEQISRFVLEMDEFKGPGRGSAAGCLVSYAIDITDIKPNEHGLLMERFLQPERIGYLEIIPKGLEKKYNREDVSEELFKEHFKAQKWLKEVIKENEIHSNETTNDEIYYLRNNWFVTYQIYELASRGIVYENTNNSELLYLLGICSKPLGAVTRTARSMPDIDYDSSCRDLICDYLTRLHGSEKVAYIGTYSSLKVKSAIKEVLRIRPVDGKLMKVDDVHALTKECDKVKINEEDKAQGEAHVFQKLLEENIILQDFFKDNQDIKNDVENILGTYKSMGIHAAGIILSPTDITRITPCKWDKIKNAFVTELPKDEIEMLGLIKLDMLGISTGEDIRDCNRRIREKYGIDYMGRWEEIINNPPPEVAKAFLRSNTTSIFQMNTNVAIEGLKKTTAMENPLSTVTALTSVKRPGPMNMGMDEEYILRNNGQKKVSYLHPLLEPILKDTFGVIVYQEQVMRIARDLGGFTKFEADKIRKAMGKKKFDIIDVYGEKFVKACTEKNIDYSVAVDIWNQMAKFAEYGFNKSHAVCYAALSIICMYFKEKYPLEWIASVFERASRKNSEKDKQNFKRFYREWRRHLKSPSMLHSTQSYEIVGDKIYMPLYSIKRLGEGVASEILSLRPFKDLDDFFLKIKAHGRSNKTTIESLVYSGTLDEFQEKIKITKDVSSENIQNIKKIIKIKETLSREEIDVTILNEIEDSLFFGLNDISQEEKLEKFLNESGIKNFKLTKFNFRKYVLALFHSKYRFLKIKKSLDDKLKEIKMHRPDIVYLILSEGIENVEELKKFDLSKYFGIDGKGNSKSVKYQLTGSEEQSSYEEIIKFINVSNKDMLIKELQMLNFTSYDFNSVFEEEINKIKTSSVIVNPRQIESFNRSVAFKGDSMLSFIYDLSRGEDMKDFGQKARIISFLAKNISESLDSKQIKSVVSSFEKACLNSSTYIDKSLFINFHANIDGIEFNFNRNRYSIKTSKIFTQKQIKIIRALTGESPLLADINQRRSLEIDTKKAMYLMLYFLKFKNNEVYLNNLESFKIIDNKIDKAKKKMEELEFEENEIFDFLEIDEKKIEELILSINENSMITKYKDKINSIIFNEHEIKTLKKPFYVACTVFRPEKKMFLRDVGKGDRAQKMMRLYLSNEDSQCEMICFRADEQFVSRDFKSVPLIDQLQDFTPVLIKASFRIDLIKDTTPSLIYEKGSDSVIFLQDRLNKDN